MRSDHGEEAVVHVICREWVAGPILLCLPTRVLQRVRVGPGASFLRFARRRSHQDIRGDRRSQASACTWSRTKSATSCRAMVPP